jgi:hypothetical protein
MLIPSPLDDLVYNNISCGPRGYALKLHRWWYIYEKAKITHK